MHDKSKEMTDSDGRTEKPTETHISSKDIVFREGAFEDRSDDRGADCPGQGLSEFLSNNPKPQDGGEMSHESLNCDKKGKYSVQVAEADVFTPEEKLHVCEECGSSFLDRKKLSQHARRVHRRALNLTCKRCPFRTSEEQGSNSIENIWLEFWLEKRLEIPF